MIAAAPFYKYKKGHDMTKQQIIPGKMGQFVRQMGALIERAQGDEEMILSQGASLLQALVCEDDWLPESCAIPDTRFYQQYLLYCDPRERFSVVSFVWGPGQSTPIHDHTVWGLVGMLRGAEKEERFALEGDSLVQLAQPGCLPVTSAWFLPASVIFIAFPTHWTIRCQSASMSTGAI